MALSVDDADLVLVTWDQDLAHAGLSAGRSVVPRAKTTDDK
jgi:hypothetical protein